jgi:hypothetical protein
MIVPGKLDLAGDRWTPFVTTLRFKGMDLTGAAMEAHIRLYPDAPGAALVDLDTVTTTNTQGLRLVSVETIDGVKVSTVAMQINETAMEGLGSIEGREPGTDLELAWDFVTTLVAAFNPNRPFQKQRYVKGTFTVQAGVTQ